MKKSICYCFSYSEEDIIKDVRENRGQSLIMERILSEKKKDSCNCAVTNPLGR